MILRFDDVEEVKDFADFLDSKLAKRLEKSENTENTSNDVPIKNLFEKIIEIEKNQDELSEKILVLNNHIDSILVLKKNYLNNLKELREEISYLRKKVDNLEEKKEKKDKKSRKKPRNYNNQKFEIYKTSCVPFNNVTIDKEGTLFFVDSRGLNRKINFTLPHLLYLNEVESKLTSTTANQLAVELGITTPYLSKLIYNIRLGNFKEIIDRFISNSKKIDVKISKNNTISVNGILTSLLKEDAYGLLLNIQNSNNGLFKTIYNKYKSYKHINIDECLFYSFCINYDNSDLIKMLGPKQAKRPIENNPQKRRENRGL